RERIPTTQGRAGNAADLSPDRAAGQGSHLRRGAGAAGPKTSGPTAQRGGSRSVPGAGDGGIVDRAAGDLPPGGPIVAPGGDRGLARRTVGPEDTEARRPATAGATRGGGYRDVAN